MSDSENQFLRVRVKDVPHLLEEAFTQLCFDFGASGVAEALQFTQASLRYEPEVVEAELHDIDVFFESLPAEDFYIRLQTLLPESLVEKNFEENKDWLEEWKKGYEPFALAEDYWVVPSWRETPAAAKKAIFIDPGMAFGTGTHATTQLASQLILKALPELPRGFSVIDVGTGTGILAMLAKLAGAGVTLGTEIDELARVVARENCERNQLSEIEIPDLQVEQLDQQYDLVIANIIDGILLDIKLALLDRMHPQGKMILTGILQEREEGFVRDFLKDTSLKIDLRASKEEWVGLVVSRANDAQSEELPQ